VGIFACVRTEKLIHHSHLRYVIGQVNVGFFFHVSTVLTIQGILIVEVSRLHSLRHTAFGRTPLDKCSARRRGL